MYRKHPWPYGRDWTQTKYRASLLYNNRPSMRSRHINVSLSAPIVQFDELEVVNTSIRDFRNMVCHLFAANTAELLWTQHQNKYTEVTLLKSYLAALVYIWIVVALSLDINSFTSNPLARFRTEVGLSMLGYRASSQEHLLKWDGDVLVVQYSKKIPGLCDVQRFSPHIAHLVSMPLMLVGKQLT